ncbi:hypothetical protein COCOBI_03-0960 [Coccomyxa sp. Obi]|nr:hypothetical protein COCOBI_03-0960 [Coccomyxa sp. Obi]
MATKFPPMYNEQASLILLNISQTLLVRQNDARYKQYLGLGAAEACWRALQLLPAAFAKQQNEPGGKTEKKVSQYVDRLMKAYVRLGKAEMSCVNFPAALRHLTIPVELAGDRGHLYNVEEIRRLYRNAAVILKSVGCKVPLSKASVNKESRGELWRHSARHSLNLGARKMLSQFPVVCPWLWRKQMTNLAWKHAWQNIDGVDTVFSCGRLKGQDIFVARQASKGKFLYYICTFAEGDGGRPYMAALTKYSRPVTKGVYSCGAVVGDCLYLLTEPANFPDIMLCVPLCKRDGSASAVSEAVNNQGLRQH